MAQERRRRKKSVKADENNTNTNTNTNIDTNIDTTDSDGKKEPGQNVGSEGKREMGKGFRKEELPLWGYLLASLVFLFAAIAVRPPKNDTSFPLPQRQLQLQFQRRLNPWDQVATDHSVLDSVMSGMHQTGASGDFISQVFAASGGALNQNFDVDTLLRFYHALPKKAFIYAIFVAVIGILLSGGLIAWMRHIALRGGGNGRYVFGQAGNGYFALCAMFLCAMGNSGLTIDRVRQEAKKADFFVHCLTPTSVIVVIELTLGVPWGEWNNRSHSEIATYALVVSVLTLCYGLVTAVLAWYWNNFRLGATIRLVLTIVFLVLWIVAAAMTTFVGPFRTTGNGYFCVWACVLFTVCSFVTIKREILGAETQQNAAPEPAPEPALELATTQTNTSEIV
eukprot:jgi/Psemu1/321595/estExt_fgenesh1_pg.C_50059